MRFCAVSGGKDDIMNETTLRDRFLQGMSRAAATVNVVTTDGAAGRAGVTVSAMTSVSADGDAPTMLVCVHYQSRTAQVIIDNGCFAANVLRDDQSYISDSFAGRRPNPDGDKFACAEFTPMLSGAPRVVDPLVAFDCKVQSSERVGTHHIIIGEVQEVFVAQNGSPLIFANRNYGAAEKIIPFRARDDRPAEALKIGAMNTFGPYVLPSILARMEAEKGPIKVEICEGNQRRILELLRCGDIDLALLYDLELGDEIQAEPLMDMRAYALLGAGHPMADQDRVSLVDLAEYPAILLDAPPSRGYFLSLYENLGLTPKIAYRIRGLEMARGMVANGLGYCLMATRPAGDLAYDGQPVIVKALCDELPQSRMVLARRNDDLPPAAEIFAGFCREIFCGNLD